MAKLVSFAGLQRCFVTTASPIAAVFNLLEGSTVLVASPEGEMMMINNLGTRIFGLAAVWLGLVGLVWGDFAAFWQPVPDGIPGRSTLAYLAAGLFVLSGAAVQHRRFRKSGAVGLMVLYMAFTLLWSRRIVGYPSIMGTWSGTAEQLVPAMGAYIIYLSVPDPHSTRGPRPERIVQIAFGLCQVSFGLVHFEALPQTSGMVPQWIPPSQVFWAYATGVFHLAAAIAFLTNFASLLAARLLTLMFTLFSVLIWIPRLFHQPIGHMTWAGNAINLALIASAWLLAMTLAERRRSTQQSKEGDPVSATGVGDFSSAQAT